MRMCVCVCVCRTLFRHVHVCVCVYLPITQPPACHLLDCLSIFGQYVCLPVCQSVYMCMHVYIHVSKPVSLSHCLPDCLFINFLLTCLYVCLVCLSDNMSMATCLLICFIACLPLLCLNVSPIAYLPACLPYCLSANLHAYLPVYIYIYIYIPQNNNPTEGHRVESSTNFANNLHNDINTNTFTTDRVYISNPITFQYLHPQYLSHNTEDTAPPQTISL